MLRSILKASSTALRRISTSAAFALLPTPKSIGITTPHRSLFLAAQLRSAPVFLPGALGQARGYARGGRAPSPSDEDFDDDDEEEEELSDGAIDTRGIDYDEDDLDVPVGEISDDVKLDDDYDFD